VDGAGLAPEPAKARLAAHGITHRRGGYRDPESQAFIESWFGKLSKQLVWRSESRPSSKRETRSATTATATTSAPTAASATAPHADRGTPNRGRWTATTEDRGL